IADFYVCGLPRNASASFDANPSTSTVDFDSPLRASARTKLSVAIPYDSLPDTYSLAVFAMYKSENGSPVGQPAGGAYVTPNAFLLTVGSAGHASLTVPSAAGLPSTSNCSPIDSSFRPAPTATPGASDVAVTASVSNTKPAPGELVQVTGKVTVRGQPQYGAAMTAKWYFPFSVGTCNGVTDATGQATCSITNAHTLPGFLVLVQVSFSVNGQTYYGYVNYTM
ncbi:MAG TPA: hypothetical protein VF221_04045, partial [Chloroflexota bacterium]